MERVLWKLSGPASGLLREPRFYLLQQRRSCLWWVAEKDEGGGRHEALVFKEARFYRFTHFLSLDYASQAFGDKFCQLVDLGQTALLEEIAANSARNRPPLEGLKHMVIFFDDGLFEFVCQDFEFQSPFDVNEIEEPLRRRILAGSKPL